MGAGPGDAGLLTLKALRLLRNADIVLYDNLVGPGVLSLLPPDAQTVYVGKREGKHAMPQGDLNRLLIQKAREGKRVVRLKGGDPLLFGRGGEELEALAEAGIPFAVIPGISAAIAVPGYFGIPLTHRDCSSQVHIVTAHSRSGAAALDWKALVRAGGTLVIFMGAASVEAVCRGLMEAGMPPGALAALLERGTGARQKKVIAALDRLAAEAAKQSCGSPALIIAGGVCAYSDKLSWYEKQPLAALRIGVTRPRDRAKELCNLLADAGAEAVQIPVMQTRIIAETPRLRRALHEAAQSGAADWLVFTSPRGVQRFFEKLKTYRIDIRRLKALKFAAIGSATASELEKRGIIVDVVPAHFSGADLCGALLGAVKPGARAILPRSSLGGAYITDALRNAGIECLDIPLYETINAAQPADAAYWERLIEDLDLCVFTAASTVKAFAARFGPHTLNGLGAFCIGKETAAAAEAYGAKTFIAENATVEAIVQGIISARNRGLL